MADLIEIVKRNQKPNMVVAEIGCWDGGTTEKYVEIIKNNNGKLIVVDWFMGSHAVGGMHAYQPHNVDQIYNEFVRKMNNKNCMDVVKIYKKTSLQAVTEIIDESIDIVYIDADHRYSSVKADILAWMSKVKNGGILSGHDYDNCSHLVNTFSLEQLESDMAKDRGGPDVHAGVVQAVHEVFGSDFETYNISWIKRINRNNNIKTNNGKNKYIISESRQIDLIDGRRIWVPVNGNPFWVYPFHKIDLTEEEIKEYLQ